MGTSLIGNQFCLEVASVMFEYDLPFENEQNIEFNTPVQVISAMVMSRTRESDHLFRMQTFDQQMAASESRARLYGRKSQCGRKTVTAVFQ